MDFHNETITLFFRPGHYEIIYTKREFAELFYYDKIDLKSVENPETFIDLINENDEKPSKVIKKPYF